MILLTGSILLIPNFTNNENKKGILTSELTIEELLAVYKIDHTVNRDIRYDKIAQLEKYISQVDTELGIYIPAIMLSYEGKSMEIDNNDFMFKKQRNFIVLDGQHRIKAIESYIKKENNQEVVRKLLESKITTQIYFNLNEQEKRKLFIEINGTSKNVSKNISVNFDDRNPMNSLVSDLLKNKGSNPILKMGVEMERSRLVRPGNTKWISMIRLSRFISHLLLGTQEPSSANIKVINKQYEEVFAFLQQFFIILALSLPDNPGDVVKNILGHEAVQNAIAIVCYKNIIIKDDNINFREGWKQKVEMLQYIDWSTESNPFKDLTTISKGKTKYVTFPDNKHYDLVPILERKLYEIQN